MSLQPCRKLVHLLHRKRNNKNFKKNAFQLQSLPEDWKQQVSYYQELEAQQEIVTQEI
jgi:hypothetical protein